VCVFLDWTHHIGRGGQVLDDNAAVGTCLAGLVANEPRAEALCGLEIDGCDGAHGGLTV